MSTDLRATAADAFEAAVNRLGGLLKVPEDLDKTEAIRNKILAEKEAIHAQLKTIVQGQLDDVSSSLGLLDNSFGELQRIENNLATIDQLCIDCQTLLPDYPQIKAINLAHKNLSRTHELSQELERLPSTVASATKSLLAFKHTETSASESLLKYHYVLVHIDKFRDEVARLCQRCNNPKLAEFLISHFTPAEQYSQLLESKIWELTKILVVLSEEAPYVIVHLLRIIEYEELADGRTPPTPPSPPLPISQPPSSSSGKGRFGRSEAEPSPPIVEFRGTRRPKQLKEKFFAVIRQTIEEEFRLISPFGRGLRPPATASALELAEETAGEALETCLKTIVGFFESLQIVRNEVALLVPPNYNIYEFFVRQVHLEIYKIVEAAMTKPPDAKSILFMVRWVRQYYQYMEDKLGIMPSMLSPTLIGERYQELMSDYVRLVQSKLNDWITNLIRTEEDAFYARNQPPEMDSAGLFATSSSVLLFQMVQQQFDLAVGAENPQLIGDVMGVCIDVLLRFQRDVVRYVDEGMAAYLADMQNAATGIVEYCVATINNFVVDQEYCDQVCQRCETVMIDEPGVFVDLKRRFMIVSEGFIEAARVCSIALVQVVMADLKSVYTQFFAKFWYISEPIGPLIATIKDYVSDFQAHMNVTVFEDLMIELLERVIIQYLQAMLQKSAVIKHPDAVRLMDADITELERFFRTYLSDKVVKSQLLALRDMREIIAIEDLEMVSFYSVALQKHFPDAPLAVVKRVLGRRKDLEKSQIKAILADMVQSDAAAQALVQPTVFGRIVWQTKKSVALANASQRAISSLSLRFEGALRSLHLKR